MIRIFKVKPSEKASEILEGISSIDAVINFRGNGKGLNKASLDLVKYLKSEHYIGTKEALEVVRTLRRPSQYAGEFNERFLSGVESYMATPERLTGFYRNLRSLYFNTLRSIDRFNLVEPISREKLMFATTDYFLICTSLEEELCRGLKLQSSFGNLDFLSSEEKSPPFTFSKSYGLDDRVGNLFLYANLEKVENDKDFGEFLVEHIRDTWWQSPPSGIKVPSLEKAVFTRRGEYYDVRELFIEALASKLEKKDWGRELSKKAYLGDAKNICKSQVNLCEIILKLRTDGAEDRLQHKRQILQTFFDKFPDICVRFGGDYNSFMNYLKEQVRPNGWDEERLLNVGESATQFLEICKRGNLPPDYIKDVVSDQSAAFEKIADMAIFKYVVKALAGEKRFFEKHMAEGLE